MITGVLAWVVLLSPLHLAAQPTFDRPAESDERRQARIVNYARSDGRLAVKVYRGVASDAEARVDGLLVVQRSDGKAAGVKDYEHRLSPRELEELLSAIATSRLIERTGGDVTRELSGLLDQATRKRNRYLPKTRLQLSLEAGSVPGREDRLAFDLELPGSLADYAGVAPGQPAVRMLRQLIALLERLSHHPSLTEVPTWHRQWTAADAGLPAASDGGSTLWLDWHMLLDLDCFLRHAREGLEVTALPGRQELQVEIVRTPARLAAPRRAGSAFMRLIGRSPPASGSFFVLRPEAPAAGTAELSLTIDGKAFCRHGTDRPEPVSGIERVALKQPWASDAAIHFDLFQPTLEAAAIRDGSVFLIFSEVLDLTSVDREIRLDGRPTRWLKSHDGLTLRSLQPVAPGPRTLTIGTGPLDRGGRGLSEPVEISFQAEAGVDKKIWPGGQTGDPRPAADVTTARADAAAAPPPAPSQASPPTLSALPCSPMPAVVLQRGSLRAQRHVLWRYPNRTHRLRFQVLRGRLVAMPAAAGAVSPPPVARALERSAGLLAVARGGEPPPTWDVELILEVSADDYTLSYLPIPTSTACSEKPEPSRLEQLRLLDMTVARELPAEWVLFGYGTPVPEMRFAVDVTGPSAATATISPGSGVGPALQELAKEAAEQALIARCPDREECRPGRPPAPGCPSPEDCRGVAIRVDFELPQVSRERVLQSVIEEWTGEEWSRSTPGSVLGSRQVIGLQLREMLPLDEVRSALVALPDTLTDAGGTPVAFEIDHRRGFGDFVEIRPASALEPNRRYRLRIYEQVLINPRDAPQSRRQVEVEFLGSELPVLIDRFPPVVRRIDHWHGFPELWLSERVAIGRLAAAVTLDGRRVAWIYRRDGELHRYRSLEQLGIGEHVLEVDGSPLDDAGQPILKQVRLSFEVVPWVSASLCRDPDSGLGKRTYTMARGATSMTRAPGCPEPPPDR